MAENDNAGTAETRKLIDQRLDTIDRALLGLLPRSERLALVSQLETRCSELSGLTEVQAALAVAPETPVIAASMTAGSVRTTAAPSTTTPTGKKRSGLALYSGILGIVALALLFAFPVTYLIVAMLVEAVGELAVYVCLGTHVLLVAGGGLLALCLGVAGLVSLSRSNGKLVGYGWAITGLCTAPLPAFVGGLICLMVIPAVLTTSVSPAIMPVATVSYSPSSSPGSTSTMPYPVAAAPSNSAYAELMPLGSSGAAFPLPSAAPVCTGPACAAPLYKEQRPLAAPPADPGIAPVGSRPLYEEQQPLAAPPAVSPAPTAIAPSTLSAPVAVPAATASP